MIEAQLPTYVSRGAVSADDWNTQVNVLPNGVQTRIARQSMPLGRWNIDFETVDKAEHIELRDFKLAVQGSAIAFRVKDWGDFESDGEQSCSPAVGNGVTTAFQLKKTYSAPTGGTAYVRTVTKPVASTVKVYKAGVLQTLATHYTLDSTTGIITFLVAPTGGQTVKATYQFDKVGHFVNDDNPHTIDMEATDEDGNSISVYHHTGMELEEVDEI